MRVRLLKAARPRRRERRRRSKTAAGCRLLEPATPSGLLESARQSSGAALSCSLGFPISLVSRTDGTQDYPEPQSMRYGTYKVFRNRTDEDFQAKLGAAPALHRVKSVLNGSYAYRLKDPDFIRTFASGILLVKPGSRKHNLPLKYSGDGWYSVKGPLTLSVARKLAGWALSSPSTVLHIWGSSLRELAQMCSDQILWLLSNWRLLLNKSKSSKPQTVFEEWLGSGGLPSETREIFTNLNDPRIRVGHSRSVRDPTWQVWVLRCRSRVCYGPRSIRIEHTDADQTSLVSRSNTFV